MVVVMTIEELDNLINGYHKRIERFYRQFRGTTPPFDREVEVLWAEVERLEALRG